MMGISVWKLLIILAIVIVLFGTGRLSGIGSDLGKAMARNDEWLWERSNDAPCIDSICVGVDRVIARSGEIRMASGFGMGRETSNMCDPCRDILRF
jgi:sec-independent protein translocase protein TatA